MTSTFVHILRCDGVRGLYNGVRLPLSPSLISHDASVNCETYLNLRFSAIRFPTPATNVLHHPLRRL